MATLVGRGNCSEPFIKEHIRSDDECFFKRADNGQIYVVEKEHLAPQPLHPPVPYVLESHLLRREGGVWYFYDRPQSRVLLDDPTLSRTVRRKVMKIIRSEYSRICHEGCALLEAAFKKDQKTVFHVPIENIDPNFTFIVDFMDFVTETVDGAWRRWETGGLRSYLEWQKQWAAENIEYYGGVI